MSTAINYSNGFVNKSQNQYSNLYLVPQATPKRRVLIVEDDKDTADAIRHLLESFCNTECAVAADPYEALLELSDNKFDFLFVDQMLPGMSGGSVLNQIDKFIDEDPLIIESGNYNNVLPVVLMSAADKWTNEPKDLKHFEIKSIIRKDELGKFLANNFMQ